MKAINARWAPYGIAKLCLIPELLGSEAMSKRYPCKGPVDNCASAR